jgi:hypothetical protein
MLNPLVLSGRSSNVINAWSAPADAVANATAKMSVRPGKARRSAVSKRARMESLGVGGVGLVFLPEIRNIFLMPSFQRLHY